MTLDEIAGVAHEPAGTPIGVVVLTHGAGGSRESPLLIAVCDEWARRGWLAVRYNLPFRRRRPKGPPSGSSTADQAGIVEAVTVARGMTDGPVIAGGHSYGGRLTSMAVAEGLPVDVLTPFSYPLHPPGKPEKLRIEHFAALDLPCLFVSGMKDPFGSPEELEAQTVAIPGPVTHVWLPGGHDPRNADDAIVEAIRDWLTTLG